MTYGNDDHAYDFKNSLSDSLLEACGIPSFKNIEDFYECFDNITVNDASMVSRTRKFYYRDYTFENTTFSTWKTMNSFYYGRCVTSNNIDSLKDGQFLKIYLNTSLAYRIWIHDPNLFYLSLNPKSTPKLALDYNPLMTTSQKNYKSNFTSVLQYLEQEKYKAINRKKVWINSYHTKLNISFKKEPCKDYDYEKGKSFSNCLVEFINKNSTCKVSNRKTRLGVQQCQAQGLVFCP